MTSSQNCDMYLMLASEIPKLESGGAFNYLKFDKEVNSAEFTFSDTASISKGVVAVVVNSYSPAAVNADYIIEWQIPASFTSILIAGGIFVLIFLAICGFCCIISSVFGGRRYMQRGGYYEVNHYNSGYGGNSYGGNSYSGSSGGNSYSGGISGGSSGGNSYSGGISGGSGGNSYN